MCFNILEDCNGCYNSDSFKKVLDFWFFYDTDPLDPWSISFLQMIDNYMILQIAYIIKYNICLAINVNFANEREKNTLVLKVCLCNPEIIYSISLI